MPGRPYFLANTFSHILGCLILTGVSVGHPLFEHMGRKPITNLTLVALFFSLVYFTHATEPGLLKYFMFFLLCFLKGQIIVGQVNNLKLNSELSNVLLQGAIMFGTLTVIGIVDKQNMLSWGFYLSAVLMALLIFHIVSYFFSNEKKKNISTWISHLIMVIFAFYVGFDIEVLKDHATELVPDYINESMNLFLIY